MSYLSYSLRMDDGLVVEQWDTMEEIVLREEGTTAINYNRPPARWGDTRYAR
ncbi:MAG: hypothetical protein OES12_04975 [Anaerolineae bacterium]|nr:hypothetical protein [Anaerolineae bacterium]